MYEKDFDKWNIDKKELDIKHVINVYPKVRHIMYAKIGLNVGYEADGKKNFLRPVLIMSKLGSLYYIVPLTSKAKYDQFHYKLSSVSFKNIDNSLVMLTQARIIDRLRFQNEIGIVSKNEFEIIQKIMRKMYFPSFK